MAEPFFGKEQIAECRWKVYIMRKGKWQFDEYPSYYTDVEIVRVKDLLERQQKDGRITGYEINHLAKPFIRKQIPLYF